MVEQLRLDNVGTPEFLDTIYELLANSCRRELLRYLAIQPTPVLEHRLAIELAATKHGVITEEVTADQQQEVALLLRHVHLPALHNASVIRWDQDEQLVTVEPILKELTVTFSDPASLLDPSVSRGS